MARKPPVSYAAMELDRPELPPPAVQPEPASVAVPVAQPVRAGGKTLKEASAHLMTYVHPDAAKALKRYAVENNCKVHDICIEALQAWFDSHGLREKVKAEPKRSERRDL
jgi:hypothetical protein